MRWKLWLLFVVAMDPAGRTLYSAEDQRAAEPKEADQKKAEKQVREVYKADYDKPTPEKMKALAVKLLQKAPEERDNLPARFILLKEARDLALLSGDGPTALAAMDEMAKVFKIDAVAAKRTAVISAARSARAPEAARGVAGMGIVLAREAWSADDDEWTKKMLAAASEASAAAKDPALAETLRALNAEAAEAERRHRSLKNAEKTLKEKPEDPAAALLVGKFLALIRDDWKRGLRLLTHGTDLELVRLSEEDLAGPVEPQGQIDLGNGWLKLAEKASGPEKLAMKLRGASWLVKGCSRIDGLNRDKLLQGVAALVPEIPFTRMAWEGLDAPSGLVIVRHNGKDQRGWTALSGVWKFSGQIAGDEGNGKARYIVSTLAATWVRIAFEFKAGNPVLTFPTTSGETPSGGVSFNNEGRWNHLKTDIDMSKWHTVRLERVKDRVQVYFDEKQYNDASLGGPNFIQIKSDRGELRIRTFVAIGYNP